MNLVAPLRVSLLATASTCTRSPNLRATWVSCGASVRHGAHQLAKKFTTTGLPA